MKLPRNLGGRALADHLISRFDYREIHQRGSHIILETVEPSRQRIAVPAHSPLKLGTLNGILRSISQHKGIPKDKLLP